MVRHDAEVTIVGILREFDGLERLRLAMWALEGAVPDCFGVSDYLVTAGTMEGEGIRGRVFQSRFQLKLLRFYQVFDIREVAGR